MKTALVTASLLFGAALPVAAQVRYATDFRTPQTARELYTRFNDAPEKFFKRGRLPDGAQHAHLQIGNAVAAQEIAWSDVTLARRNALCITVWRVDTLGDLVKGYCMRYGFDTATGLVDTTRLLDITAINEPYEPEGDPFGDVFDPGAVPMQFAPLPREPHDPVQAFRLALSSWIMFHHKDEQIVQAGPVL